MSIHVDGESRGCSALWPHFTASGKLQSLGVQADLALQESIKHFDAARVCKLQCAGVTGDISGPPTGTQTSLLSSAFSCNQDILTQRADPKALKLQMIATMGR